MARFIKLTALLAMVFAAVGTSTASDEKRDVLIRRVYSVGDLPVMKETGHGVVFDATILLAYIQTAVEPESWMSAGKGAGELQPFPQNMSLVVSQTEANHRKIAILLENMRDGEAAAKVRPGK